MTEETLSDEVAEQTQQEEADTFKHFTAQIGFVPEDVVGRPLVDGDEAIKFASMTEAFFGSEYVYNLFVAFVRTNWEPQSPLIVPDKPGLILP